MPFNGSGVYTPPVADFPVVTNTVISSTHFNNTINDIATGISNCLAKDGQSTPTANIKLGNFKLTGVGAPTVNGDALVFGSPATVTTLSGTTLTASTSVVTPLVGNTTDTLLGLMVNNGARWNISSLAAGVYAFFPTSDNTNVIGGPGNRVNILYASTIDSGTTGSLSLRTNNGTAILTLTNALVASLSSGGTLQLGGAAAQMTTGAGVTDHYDFYSGVAGSTTALQFQILGTASANRNITVTGSNGGNPTISTTAGNLAITPSVTIAGTGLIVANATAIPAGGTAGVGMAFSSTTNFGVFFGSGIPSLTAAKGSLYLRSDGTGTSDRIYVNVGGGWSFLTAGA